MKILIITQFYHPEPVPKPHELAEELVDKGHQVTVLTCFPSYPGNDIFDGYRQKLWHSEILNQVTVIRLPIYPSHDHSVFGRIANYASFFVSLTMIGNFLVGRQDLVYVWGNPPTVGLAGWLISIIHRGKFVYGIHDLWPELPASTDMLNNKTILDLIKYLEQFLWRRAARIIVVTDSFKVHLVEHGIAPEKLHIIHHWADDEVYHPVPHDLSLAKDIGVEGKFVVLFAGNIGLPQGLDSLIEAADKLKTINGLRFVIVGDGVERRNLIQEAESRNLTNMIFVDKQPAENMRHYFGLADVLYASLADHPYSTKIIPSKIASYLACGRPVLSNIPGDTAALLGEADCGLSVSTNDLSSLTDAITTFLNMNENQLEELGRNARSAFLKYFSKSKLIEQHEQVFLALSADRKLTS